MRPVGQTRYLSTRKPTCSLTHVIIHKTRARCEVGTSCSKEQVPEFGVFCLSYLTDILLLGDGWGGGGSGYKIVSV